MEALRRAALEANRRTWPAVDTTKLTAVPVGLESIVYTIRLAVLARLTTLFVFETATIHPAEFWTETRGEVLDCANIHPAELMMLMAV